MRTTIVLALMAFAAVPTHAWANDIPGDGSTQAGLPVSGQETLGTFEGADDVDWYKTNLKAGKDYAISANAIAIIGFDVTLRGVDGKSINTATASDYTAGFEFRPKITGIYFLEAKKPLVEIDPYPVTYAVRVSTDCRANKDTACTIKVGQSQKWLLSSSVDVDWIKTSLKVGKYTAKISSSNSVYLDVLDPTRKVINTEGEPFAATFKASLAGTYYLRIRAGDEFGGQYTLSLARGGQ